ncbi:MAG: stage II sporulation protein E [Clostridium sp.]|jgi:stage II sporulation protein E|uniref:stage II sporulation protein E n=1 Tax=Clostridium sp. TaxID=1506 RepID=UPI0025BB958D|nr:stage II sporulation protein E [Clostridium sp.]MCH3965628.1 stage II sporulation protein E [Clostridium sp.]MCI1717137.1 stage II sporulation protein E [Clostridium sp.]MCI1801458.1 stage II sporulation protein E [Clostridium sp.]MCI1815323.1 stage II sporulation protein E [Clostridium sp.]MCI1872207.1 stage II sporulation protein E [Clostridium sp.]
MQYELEVFPYQRSEKLNKQERKGRFKDPQEVLKLVFYFLAAFLVARVMMVNLMAPFGIAFLTAVVVSEKRKIACLSALGTIIGYISMYGNIKYPVMYCTISIVLMAVSYILKGLDKSKKLILIFASVLAGILFYKFLIVKLSFSVALFNAFFEILCIFPLYFIINYSIICFKELRTRHLYSNEEIISMAVTISFIVSGTWGIMIYGVSFRNIIALTFVLMLGYIKGSAQGAASGVAMGTIIGITSNEMLVYIAVYGLCGLISGIFRETGKCMSACSYMVVFIILKLYSNIGPQFKVPEILISCAIFIIIPKTIYKQMETELDWQKKRETQKENYADKIKSVLVERLENFAEVLSNMSLTLGKLADNDKLAMKSKSSALVENLADRVCSNCSMRALCWKRESYNTYNTFVEIIQNYQEKKEIIPPELERKCIKRTMLVDSTHDIVNNYVINEMWRDRLSECRELLADQIGNMSRSVSEIVNEFNTDIKFNTDIENKMRRILTKNKIQYRDVFCFNDKNQHLIMRMSMEACGGEQKCIKQILPLVNNVTGKLMCVSEDGCKIDKSMKDCSITFEETPKYHIAAYVSRKCKDGEKYNGDSYTYGNLPDGSYMTIISDGMGSGPQAYKESSASVELIKKFAVAGFNKLTAINTVNSIMSIKFTQDEKFSTLDLNSIDLYKGEVDFMKVGAVASFIKRGNEVDVIKSKTLPIGVLDKPDIEIINRKILNGDFIIIVSDGVLDYNAEVAGSYDWMVKFLKEFNCNDPKKMGEEIIRKAVELSENKVKDDMTVIVEKVYSLY